MFILYQININCKNKLYLLFSNIIMVYIIYNIIIVIYNIIIVIYNIINIIYKPM